MDIDVKDQSGKCFTPGACCAPPGVIIDSFNSPLFRLIEISGSIIRSYGGLRIRMAETVRSCAA
jgi:hypothetical protein